MIYFVAYNAVFHNQFIRISVTLAATMLVSIVPAALRNYTKLSALVAPLLITGLIYTYLVYLLETVLNLCY